MEKIVKRYDFKELIKRFKEYCDIKMKYNYEKWKNERDERYLNISFFVYYSKKINVPKDERLYIHDGIRCDKCLVYPIQGHRYYCPICPLYNLCALCERLEPYENNPHEHDFIKIRKKEDLDKSDNRYKFEIQSSNLTKNYEIKTNKNHTYNMNIKNTGKESWPKENTISYIKELSELEMQETKIGNVEPGKTKSFTLKLISPNFRKSNVKNIVLTLKAKLRNNEEIKFLFPTELRFFEKYFDELLYNNMKTNLS